MQATWFGFTALAKQAEAFAARSDDQVIRNEWLCLARSYRRLAERDIARHADAQLVRASNGRTDCPSSRAAARPPTPPASIQTLSAPGFHSQ